MKTLKITLLVAFALMVSSSFASKMVKSRLGDLDLMATKGGDKILCTMGFNAELALLREAETEALVREIAPVGFRSPKSSMWRKLQVTRPLDLAMSISKPGLTILPQYSFLKTTMWTLTEFPSTVTSRNI